MTSVQKDCELRRKLEVRANIVISIEDARILRRAEMTLRRWFELECGDGDNYGSWAIERDDNGDGLPFMVRHHYGQGNFADCVTRTRIPDREAGARKRIKEVCDRLGISFYIQTDPRGCALYVSPEPLTDSAYTNGVAVCI